MANGVSFYSIKEDEKSESDRRYHTDNVRCGPGSEIPEHNKLWGANNHKLCEHCADLT